MRSLEVELLAVAWTLLLTNTGHFSVFVPVKVSGYTNQLWQQLEEQKITYLDILLAAQRPPLIKAAFLMRPIQTSRDLSE